MGRHVEDSYLVDLLNQAYLNQEENCYFCMRFNCNFCQRTLYFEEELREKKFNSENPHVQNWFIIYFRKNHNKITIFSVKKQDD